MKIWSKITAGTLILKLKKRGTHEQSKKIMVVCVVLAAVGMLSACGTVKGFGRDVSSVGGDIQRAAH